MYFSNTSAVKSQLSLLLPLPPLAGAAPAAVVVLGDPLRGGELAHVVVERVAGQRAAVKHRRLLAAAAKRLERKTRLFKIIGRKKLDIVFEANQRANL